MDRFGGGRHLYADVIIIFFIIHLPGITLLWMRICIHYLGLNEKWQERKNNLIYLGLTKKIFDTTSLGEACFLTFHHLFACFKKIIGPFRPEIGSGI